VRDREIVAERLRAYYLFIGVADDAVDSLGLDAGREILSIFTAPIGAKPHEPRLADAILATENLKHHIQRAANPLLIPKLHELYCHVVLERNSTSMSDYIRQRERVGQLTAEVSFLLIEPFLIARQDDLWRLFRKVGEVGCLFDSVVDLRSDERLGLLRFKPTPRERFALLLLTLSEGLRLTANYPRMLGLFCEAALDVVLERVHTRSSAGALERPNEKLVRERAALTSR
jgi:hypothetical protein